MTTLYGDVGFPIKKSFTVIFSRCIIQGSVVFKLILTCGDNAAYQTRVMAWQFLQYLARLHFERWLFATVPYCHCHGYSERWLTVKFLQTCPLIPYMIKPQQVAKSSTMFRSMLDIKHRNICKTEYFISNCPSCWSLHISLALCIDDLVCSGDTIGDRVFFGVLLRAGLVILQNVNSDIWGRRGKSLGHFQSVFGPQIARHFQGWSVFQNWGRPLILKTKS